MSPQEGLAKNRVILLLLVATASAAVIAWFALKYVNDQPLAFERSRWLQAREKEDSRVLTRMAKDLIARKALIGQSRSQLIELLGDPEKYSDATDSQLFYLISEKWNGVDPVRRDHLLISLDENGRAIDARIDVFKKNQR